MTILYYKILLFCLTPLGLLLLIIAIRILWRATNGKILLTLPFNDRLGTFTVNQAGVYSIWHKGAILKKTPAGNFKPHIRNLATNEIIKTKVSIMSPRSNDFSTGRMELFTFNAPAGEYELSLTKGSSVSSFQKAIAKVIPLKDIDLDQYFIQIRQSQSQILTMLSIPLLLLGMAGMVCGLVFGLLIE